MEGSDSVGYMCNEASLSLDCTRVFFDRRKKRNERMADRFSTGDVYKQRLERLENVSKRADANSEAAAELLQSEARIYDGFGNPANSHSSQVPLSMETSPHMGKLIALSEDVRLDREKNMGAAAHFSGWQVILAHTEDQGSLPIEYEYGTAKPLVPTVANEHDPFSPLTHEALRLLHDWLAHVREERICGACVEPSNGTYCARFLSTKSLYALCPREWLRDECLNKYFSLLTLRSQRYQREGRKMPKVWSLSTFFYDTMFGPGPYDVDRCQLTGPRVYEYSRVRNETKRFNVSELDILFVPLNLDNIHWTLVVIDIKRMVIEYFDPMGGGNSGMEKLVNIRTWLIQ